MSSAQKTSLSGTNPIDELKKHGLLIEQLVVFLQQLVIHKTVRNETLSAVQDTLNRLQSSAPNLQSITDARALWLGAWISLLEQDFEKLLNGKMNSSIFYINNQNRRWPTIIFFLKRSYLKDHFKPLYLRVEALLERIAGYEAGPHEQRIDPFFGQTLVALRNMLLEGRF